MRANVVGDALAALRAQARCRAPSPHPVTLSTPPGSPVRPRVLPPADRSSGPGSDAWSGPVHLRRWCAASARRPRRPSSAGGSRGPPRKQPVHGALDLFADRAPVHLRGGDLSITLRSAPSAELNVAQPHSRSSAADSTCLPIVLLHGRSAASSPRRTARRLPAGARPRRARRGRRPLTSSTARRRSCRGRRAAALRIEPGPRASDRRPAGVLASARRCGLRRCA